VLDLKTKSSGLALAMVLKTAYPTIAVSLQMKRPASRKAAAPPLDNFGGLFTDKVRSIPRGKSSGRNGD
jgi:hypothetical protein